MNECPTVTPTGKHERHTLMERMTVMPELFTAMILPNRSPGIPPSHPMNILRCPCLQILTIIPNFLKIHLFTISAPPQKQSLSVAGPLAVKQIYYSCARRKGDNPVDNFLYVCRLLSTLSLFSNFSNFSILSEIQPA